MIISDNLANLKTFYENCPWQRTLLSSLAPKDQELLNCLSLRDPLFVSPLPETVAIDGDLRIVLVDDAPQSQYDALISGLRAGLDIPAPLACIAFTGSNFHGQRQRPWRALRGNLHLTLYLRPYTDIAPARVGLIVLPALTVIDAVKTGAGGRLEPKIKWVNDIMLEERKIGGVLTHTQVRGDKMEALLFGIGLNVAQAPTLEPSWLSAEADSLSAHLPEIKLPDIFWQILEDFNRRYSQLLAQGSAPLLEDYRRHSLIIGREVCLWSEESVDGTNITKEEPIFCGLVSEITDDLALIVNGREISRGRLCLYRPCEKYGLQCSRHSPVSI